MPTFFKLGKKTVVNWIGIDKVATYRNTDSQLASGNVRAIDPCPDEIIFREPSPIVRYYRKGKNPYATEVVGFLPGELTIPSHDYKTAKWITFAVGKCSTTVATYEHIFQETSDELYFLGLHCAMEHATSAICHYRDLLGNTVKRWHFKFSQDDCCKQDLNIAVAYAIDGSDLVRQSFEHSYNKAVYPAGQFTHTTLYGAGVSWGCQILSGDIELNNTVVHYKQASKYPTSVLHKRRDWTIKLRVRLFNKTLLQLPDSAVSYTTNRLSFFGKYWEDANSNYMQMSFTNLYMERPMGKQIAEADYIWEGDINLTPAGARVGISACSVRIRAIDDLSNTHFEMG